MSEHFGIIYTYTNLINKKIYVGRTIDPKTRYGRYHRCELNGNRAINRAMKKYGIDNFEYKVIDHADDDISLNLLEQHYIQLLQSHTSQHGYNMTVGGEGVSGFTHTTESRKKMSIARLGKEAHIFSDEEKKKISDRKKGCRFTEEHKKKLSIAAKLRQGRVISQETRNKISNTHKNNIVRCPHCSKEGGMRAMHRWHFEHCRKR